MYPGTTLVKNIALFCTWTKPNKIKEDRHLFLPISSGSDNLACQSSFLGWPELLFLLYVLESNVRTWNKTIAGAHHGLWHMQSSLLKFAADEESRAVERTKWLIGLSAHARAKNKVKPTYVSLIDTKVECAILLCPTWHKSRAQQLLAFYLTPW